VPVSFVTLALGGDVEVPTLDGSALLKIPAETQSGRVFRLRGKGIQSARSRTKGDLLCRVQVEIPVKLTSEQKDLLKKLDVSLSENQKKHTPSATIWHMGVKRFFENLKG
jgi:molecular chaperone DnaJ